MSYCPDCGSDELSLDLDGLMATCGHCNYTPNFIEYMNRFDREMLNIYQLKKGCLTDFTVHYMAQRIAVGEFSVRNSKLLVHIATMQSSCLEELLNLLRTCFGEDVFIGAKQHGIDSKIEACPLCKNKQFMVIDSVLLCANCSRFEISIQDFVASVISKGKYICKDFVKKNLSTLDEFQVHSLSTTFFVYAGDTQREKFEFRGYALASVEIRDSKKTSLSVVAVRPIKAESDQMEEIIRTIQNTGITFTDKGTRLLKVVTLRL